MTAPSPVLRAAAVGVGAFGRHHARIYHEMASEGVRLVGLVDVDPEGPRALAERLGVPLVPRVDDLPEPVDLVSIAVPTRDHRRVAEPLLRRGVHCLVEKPIAGSSLDAQCLMLAAEEGNAILQVGLVERFNPVIAALDLLPARPAFLEVHRLAPFGARALDVGVVMDMMIHDLDLVNLIVGEEAERVEAVGVPVLSRHEDIANARITFPSGCVANVTASRVARNRMRRCRIFSPAAYLCLDYDTREAILVRPPEGGFPEDVTARSMENLRQERLPIHDAEPLRAEIGSLVHAVRSGQRPKVDGGAGLRALRLAERILEAIRSGPRPQGVDEVWLEELARQGVTGSGRP